MRLTAYSDYALRVLMYLSIQEDRLATIKEISDQYGISRNHLMKLVHDLGRNGFIETVRGKNGGLRLNGDPATISAGQVVRAMEKDLNLVECFDPDNNQCRIVKACILSKALSKALAAFLDVLDEYSIADLLAPHSDFSDLFPIDVWSDAPTTSTTDLGIRN